MYVYMVTKYRLMSVSEWEYKTMFQIIGYILFILITVASCVGAAVVGTIIGVKEEDINK